MKPKSSRAGALIKKRRDTRASMSMFFLSLSLNPGREPSSGDHIMILDFLASRIVENKLLLFRTSSQWYFVIQVQAD